MKVRGKGNRPVPCIIPADAMKPLEYIASRTSRMEAGIPDRNTYLFPNSVLNHSRSYDSLKKTCVECTLQAPGRITSVSMRKYTATLSQMLNLDKYQIGWLCQHLGHIKEIHRQHYRQMSGLIERTEITKLFLLQDLNLTKRFKGKTLEEIDLKDVIFPDGINEDPGTSTCEAIADTVNEEITQNDGDEAAIDAIVFEADESEEEEMDDNEEPLEPVTVKKNKSGTKQQFKRQRWDDLEVGEVHKYFKTYLETGITPRTKAVEAAKKQSKQNNGKLWMRSTDKIVKKISAMNHKAPTR